MDGASNASLPDAALPKVLSGTPPSASAHAARPAPRARRKKDDGDIDSSKRRCVSTACIACRKRKSKCDGNTPACAACAQVYGTQCVYDPNSDHRRKGVYKSQVGSSQKKDSTFQTLVEALRHGPEEDAINLVREIRASKNLDVVAAKFRSTSIAKAEIEDKGNNLARPHSSYEQPTFESQLSGKMATLLLDDGTIRVIGGTSNLIHLAQQEHKDSTTEDPPQQRENPLTSWTEVTDDAELVVHLLNMYWTWHASFFCTITKPLFYRDFLLGRPLSGDNRKYCSSLLVNAILALACHFTSRPAARDDPQDSATVGDHFFREAKRLVKEYDEHEKPRLSTVQAMSLMSVREAGCGREARGWVYSGIAFRMACEMGLHLDTGQMTASKQTSADEAEEDVRRITFWGCFLFDKCWSNYTSRLPQIPSAIVTVPKFEVFPEDDSVLWTPYTDSGYDETHAQPSRTRAVGVQISSLCEISNDIMFNFYNPSNSDKARCKTTELDQLSGIHSRLDSWKRQLPKEFEPREGSLSSVLMMHMFLQLLHIHLFRPFLKYDQDNSQLPRNISPRKLCTQAAASISKLVRLYKRSHGLRRICPIVVYFLHSATAIHLLNLPQRDAQRDVIYGVKHFEEMSECWPYARRTLVMLSQLVTLWNIELPPEAATILSRPSVRFQDFQTELPRPAAPSIPLSTVDAEASLGNAQQSSSLADSAIFNGDPSVANNASTHAHAAPNATQMLNYIDQIPGFDAHSGGNMIAESHTPAPQSVAAAQPYEHARRTLNHQTSPNIGAAQNSLGWVPRNQVPYAPGFANWPHSIAMDPSTWTGSINPIGRTNNVASLPAGKPAAAPVLYNNNTPVVNAISNFSATGGHNSKQHWPP